MNKYKFYLRLIFMAVTVIGMQACYEDKGNYKLHDINEITIEGIEDVYYLSVGEGLTIRPKVEGTLEGGSGDYSYEWFRFGNGVAKAPNHILMSTDQYLEDVVLPLASGTYNFFYRVTDNKTMVKWNSQVFKIALTSDAQTGILMMYEENGETRLSFLNYLAASSVFEVQEVKTSVLPALGKPIEVVTYNDKHSPKFSDATGYAVVIHTETGAYRLKCDDFSYDSEFYNYKNLIQGVEPAGFGIERIYASDHKQSNMSYIRTNTGDILCYDATQSATYLPNYAIYVNSKAVAGEGYQRINVSDKIGFCFPSKVFFDTDAKSFYYTTTHGANVLLPCLDTDFAAPAATVTPFDLQNTKSELLYIDSRLSDGESGRDKFYALLENNDDSKIRLISFGITYRGGSVRAKYINDDLSDMPNIRNALQYDMNHANTIGLVPLFFYRTDTEIYAYNMTDDKSEKVYPLEGQTLPANTKISFMNIIGGSTSTSGAFNFIDKMMVFLYDETKPEGTCGSLEVYNITALTGALVMTQSGPDGAKVDMKWEGQFGKVISADWKSK